MSGAREYVSAWVVHEENLVDWAWNLQGKQAVDWAWDLQGKLLVDWACRSSRANFSRLGMGPPWQTLVDWAWNLQEKQAVDRTWDLRDKHLVDWEWDLQVKQLLLSEARTRAVGGGEVKTGKE